MKKIAILTMHAARNYGAVLQAYATQFVLKEKFGWDAFILNYISTQRKNSRFFTKIIDKYKNASIIKKVIFLIAVFPTRALSQYVFTKFTKKYFLLPRKKNLPK